MAHLMEPQTFGTPFQSGFPPNFERNKKNVFIGWKKSLLGTILGFLLVKGGRYLFKHYFYKIQQLIKESEKKKEEIDRIEKLRGEFETFKLISQKKMERILEQNKDMNREIQILKSQMEYREKSFNTSFSQHQIEVETYDRRQQTFTKMLEDQRKEIADLRRQISSQKDEELKDLKKLVFKSVKFPSLNRLSEKENPYKEQNKGKRRNRSKDHSRSSSSNDASENSVEFIPPSDDPSDLGVNLDQETEPPVEASQISKEVQPKRDFEELETPIADLIPSTDKVESFDDIFQNYAKSLNENVEPVDEPKEPPTGDSGESTAVIESKGTLDDSGGNDVIKQKVGDESNDVAQLLSKDERFSNSNFLEFMKNDSAPNEQETSGEDEVQELLEPPPIQKLKIPDNDTGDDELYDAFESYNFDDDEAFSKELTKYKSLPRYDELVSLYNDNTDLVLKKLQFNYYLNTTKVYLNFQQYCVSRNIPYTRKKSKPKKAAKLKPWQKTSKQRGS